MTQLIAHRRNTRTLLEITPHSYGIEVDIRSNDGELIVHHDPFESGESFIDWLSGYSHGTLILNVKEEGLEPRLIKLMKEKNIESYFFLDQSFPFLIKWSKACAQRCAVRFSEYESIETALQLAGKAKWVWVDCFTRFPLDEENYEKLRGAGFNLCLVSPELQGRNAEEEIPLYMNIIKNNGFVMDAICTKRPDLWELVLK